MQDLQARLEKDSVAPIDLSALGVKPITGLDIAEEFEEMKKAQGAFAAQNARARMEEEAVRAKKRLFDL